LTAGWSDETIASVSANRRGGQFVKTLNFVVSLVSGDNDYQRAQAEAAKNAAARAGATLDITFCGGDSILQSQQLLDIVQSRPRSPQVNGIVVQPAGTGLHQVACAAAAAGMGWVLLHKRVDYMAEIHMKNGVPAFMLSSDHEEEGRIQARQVAALLPADNAVLCIIGPSTDSIAQMRLEAFKSELPLELQVLSIRGKWTDQSGYDAISSWLRLPTSRQQQIGIVACQNDAMAIGARRAVAELADHTFRDKLLGLPFLGCDGLVDSGQAWVGKGLLRATVVIPVLAGLGVEMLARAIQTGEKPSEHTVVAPVSFPPIDQLKR
jgi:ribose transport system substrate-binding protein